MVSKSPIKAINHITFAVSDLDTSIAFYNKVLGFEVVTAWRHGAYLRMEDLWLALRRSAERKGPIKPLVTDSLRLSSITSAETHVAFLVSGEDFGALGERIIDSGAVVRQEQTDFGPVLFFGDPDGHKLELHVTSMNERLRASRDSSYDGMVYPEENDENVSEE